MTSKKHREHFSTWEAYCADYDTKNYYFLNRRYKPLGYTGHKWVEYPPLEVKTDRVYFYSDATNPYNQPTKNQAIFLLNQYHGAVRDFIQKMSSEGIKEINIDIGGL